jgi:hypothetical protein
MDDLPVKLLACASSPSDRREAIGPRLETMIASCIAGRPLVDTMIGLGLPSDRSSAILTTHEPLGNVPDLIFAEGG